MIRQGNHGGGCVAGARCFGWASTILLAAALSFPSSAAGPSSGAEPDGKRLYERACAACHGRDGRGAPPSRLGFAEAIPDFTDCRFATREPDADWSAIAHEGGPARGFAKMMPAFGAALGKAEMKAILEHIRSFCGSDAWPRGELNLPRPLVTEKAYPEDELVFSTAVARDPGAIASKLVWERRFGARNQVEVVVPFGLRESSSANAWVGGLGDIAVGAKRALYHSLERGSIFSLGGEILLPTGSENNGLGKGTVVFEPFLAFGQILPADTFLQFQAGAELPNDRDQAEQEAFWRLVLGRSISEGGWRRTWSPMVELLGQRELVAGEPALWDLLPQLQVTLSTRQHVMANAGVRLPLNHRAGRDPQFLFYLLWDWFDGGFLEGW